LDRKDILFYQKYSELQNLLEKKPVNWHLKACAVLRLLLIDGPPLIHIVNRSKEERIVFPIDRSLDLSVSSAGIIHSVPSEVIGLATRASKGREELKLSAFLSHAIFSANGLNFSVLTIIKSGANKFGGIHFEEDESIENTELRLEENYQDAYQKCVGAIMQIVLIGLKNLAEKCNPFPEYQHFLAHLDASPGEVSFNGEQYLEHRTINSAPISSLILSLHIQFLPQKHSSSFFLHLRSNSSNADFKYGIKDNRLFVSVSDGNNELLCVSRIALDFKEHNIHIHIFNEHGLTKIALHRGGTRIGYAEYQYSVTDRIVDEITIGSDIQGQQGSVFSVRELSLITSSENASELLKNVTDYYEIKYNQ